MAENLPDIDPSDKERAREAIRVYIDASVPNQRDMRLFMQRKNARERLRSILGDPPMSIAEQIRRVQEITVSDVQVVKLIEALVEIAALTGEDWSAFAEDRVGTWEDVKKNPAFHRYLIDNPDVLVGAVRQLRDDSEEPTGES